MEKYTGWRSTGVYVGIPPICNYILDLPNRIESICEIFADDTSLFSKVKDETFSDELKNDWNKTSRWAFQWKRLFNPDPRKQAIEICFSNKCDNKNYS